MIRVGNWLHIFGHVTKGIIDRDVVMMYLSSQSEDGIVMRKIGDYKLYLDPLDTGESQPLLKYGWAAENNIAIYEEQVKKLRSEASAPITCIDIGANVGYTVLAAAHHLNREDSIYAIEPDPDSFDLLERNVNTNIVAPVIHTRNLALGAKTKNGVLQKQEKSNRTTVTTEFDTDESENLQNIYISTFDEFLQNEGVVPDDVGIIQMDIEGLEYNVFQGMSEFLESCTAPLLIFFEFHGFLCEYKRKFIIDALEASGFQCKIVVENGKHLEQISYSSLYKSNDRFNIIARK